MAEAKPASEKKVVIPPITDRKLGNKTHTRDPKVWKYKDGYYELSGQIEKEELIKILNEMQYNMMLGSKP